MHSLVTGGAGFLGSHVARALVASGHEVTVIDDLSGGYRENVPEGARFVQGDVTSPRDVEALFDQTSFEYVFHLAAYAAEGLSHFIRRFNYTNNVIGAMNLINASVTTSVRCFVFTSSIAVYGSGQVPMTEDMRPEPEDPYGIAKYAVELDLGAARRVFGLDSIVFRPHNVYGEGQNIADRYRNVIGIFMNQVMSDQPMTIFGDGEQTRAFTHVADVAPVIARSVENRAAYNQVFNIGADLPYTVSVLAEHVARAFGVQPRIEHLPARQEAVHAYCAHDRAQEVLDARPSVSLEEGLARMAAWAQSLGAQDPSAFGELEVTRNLPPAWTASGLPYRRPS